MYKHAALTKEIIFCAHKVHNALGYGFLERVYHNALVRELVKRDFCVEAEKKIAVYYDGDVVGDYVADMVVDGKVIVEIKAVQAISTAHECQLVNYLKATRVELGLLLNFGRSLEVKRKIFDCEAGLSGGKVEG